jgi:hypothetical protein
MGLLGRACHRLALLLLDVEARLTPAASRAETPLLTPTVANTLTEEARKMVQDGRATMTKREKKTPPPPLKGSAADIIARRNATRAGG